MKVKRPDKATAVYAGVIVVLIAIFIGLFVYGLNSVLAMEGSFPPHPLEEGLTKAPETFDEGIDFLNKSLAMAEEKKPAVSRSDSFSVDTDSFETDADETMLTVLTYISDDFEEKLESGFEKKESAFGEDMTDVIMKPVLGKSNLEGYTYYLCNICGRIQQDEPDEVCADCGTEKSFTRTDAQTYCNFMYYKCPSCGETSNIYHDSCELCGSTNSYYLCFRDCYEITLLANETALDNFAPLTKEEALSLLGDEFDDVLDIDDFNVNFDDLRIFYKVDRLTNEIRYLEYRKDMTISADVTFKGDYAVLGSKKLSFRMTEKNKFDFTWPGLELSSHDMVLAPKGSDNLLATLTCDDPTKYDVTWTSSNENAVTVDEEGYLKAGREPGYSVITASFNFNGVEYSDECLINVLVKVESLSINKRKLTLKVGENFGLVTKTDPKDATITTVTWFTDNPSIATVDETGKVTAVAPGTVSVYALSNDGYYKSSCEVTVK